MNLLQLFLLLSIIMLPACSNLGRPYSMTVLEDNKTPENDFPIDNKLYYMSYDQNICIAVVAGKIKIDANYQSYGGYREFLYSTSTELITEYEHHLTDLFKYFQNHAFSLVKRHEIDMVLDEYDLSNQALMTEELRQKFARETSATHILVVNFSRNFDDWSHTIDITERQLINVATGTVEASDYLKVRNSISPL